MVKVASSSRVPEGTAASMGVGNLAHFMHKRPLFINSKGGSNRSGGSPSLYSLSTSERSTLGLSAIRRGFELYECLLVCLMLTGSSCGDSSQCHALTDDRVSGLCCQDVHRGRQGTKRMCDRITPLSVCLVDYAVLH